jgi:hypothetical protein
MPWQWSHTAEGIANARANLALMDRDRLNEAFAEIEALGKKWFNDAESRDYSSPPFYPSIHAKAFARAKKLPHDVVADWVWEFAEEYATCDNGGFNAWACPHGCHTVSFSASGEEEDD